LAIQVAGIYAIGFEDQTEINRQSESKLPILR